VAWLKWQTSKDLADRGMVETNRVTWSCPRCQALSGAILPEDTTVRPPLHRNCGCALLPVDLADLDPVELLRLAVESRDQVAAAVAGDAQLEELARPLLETTRDARRRGS
jgi:hypothetical protein